MKNILIIILLINTIAFAQSINKKYFVEENVSGGSAFVGEFNIVEYSIKSSDNKLLYKISNKTDYDIPYSGIEVFKNGGSVLINSFYGTLAFFSSKGIKIKETKLSEDLSFEYERNIRSVVDDNSLLIIFEEDNKDNSTLQKYSSDGTLEKSLLLKQRNINSVAYSEVLDQIYISFVNWNDSGAMSKEMSLINEDGQLLKSFNANFEKGYFTEDNRFVAFSNKSLFSINTDDLNVAFLKKTDDNKLYLDVTAINGSIITAMANTPKLLNGKWVYKNPTVIKLNSSGKIIEQKNIEIPAFSDFGFWKTSRDVKFIAGDKSLTVE